MAKKLGLAAFLYCLPTGARTAWSATAAAGVFAGPAPAGLVVVSGVKDLGIELEKQEVDASDRDNNGWEGIIGALKKGPVSFKMNYNPTDPSQQAMLASFLGSGTYVPIAALDGDKAVAGTQGFWIDAEVLKYSVSQNMNGMQEVDVMLKPSALTAVPPQWVKVGA